MTASLRATARQANGDSSSTAPLLSTANGSVLPEELLYEILLRLPAKPLCRLRAVCGSWRSLLSDSSFIAAHNAHHGPLVAFFKREPAGVHIMDTSGHTVRQISLENNRGIRYGNVACTHHDMLYLLGAEERHFVCVIDPGTGDDSEFYQNRDLTSFAFGQQASSTGMTKVLSITAEDVKVLTLGGPAAGEWRDTGSPPTPVLTSPRYVASVKGILYFVTSESYTRQRIAAYDLDTEKWRPDLLRFPLPVKGPITLAELSDSLVAVYHRNYDDEKRRTNYSDVFMVLWFLEDSEKVLWSKRHIITMPHQSFRTTYDVRHGHPLWAFDDGKIVFWVSQHDGIRKVHLMRVYDTRTNTYTDGAEMSGYDFIAVYKESLLAGYHPWIRN